MKTAELPTVEEVDFLREDQAVEVSPGRIACGSADAFWHAFLAELDALPVRSS